MGAILNLRRSVLFGFLPAIAAILLPARFSRADDAPVIAKDSIVVMAAHISGSEDAPKDKSVQWKPGISFKVKGPIPDGARLFVTFGYPGHPDWSKIDCKPEEDGEMMKVDEALGSDKFTTDYVGLVDFAIRLHNELAGKDQTLFTGKAKVAKFIGPAGPQYPEYYVDEDWRIPIGYVSYEKDAGHGASFLNVLFWYRGNPATVNAHLFYKGKDIAKFNQIGNEGSDYKPNKAQWSFSQCSFLGVYENDPGDEGYDPKFAIKKNPGEYEVKVLVDKHLARSIKFTVKPDGSFDNGIATANKLGSNRVIVPVTVIGDQSQWDQQAWKTGAFYGNPLTGFTAPPAVAGSK